MSKVLKISSLALGLAVIILIIVARPGVSKIKAYYSGDAINYQNQIVITSTDTGSLEVFKLVGSDLQRVLKFKPFDPTYNKYGSFADAKLSEENGRLYVYAVSEFELYKYEISDLKSARLENKIKNSFWEWYYRVDKFGERIVTVGSKGVKIWDSNLNTIDSYDLKPSNRYSVGANNSNRFILSIDGRNLQIFDRLSRSITKEIPLDYQDLDKNHKVHYDLVNNTIYVADELYTKKFDLDGRLLGSFRHLDHTGYDVDSTAGNDFIYFSNGHGVVKLKKSDMKVATYAYTTNLAKASGWAMGLKVVNSNAGDRVVVFNNSSILVLDQNLKKIAFAPAEEEELSKPQESLYLALDHNIGSSGASVTLQGGGFFVQEPLIIDFAGQKILSQTDWSGRFSQSLTVPEVEAGWVDIKVDGQNSGLSYSINFKVQ